LQEIPSSLGNLRQLLNLNIDSNQLTTLPSTIGSCAQLGLMSIRNNMLVEVGTAPMWFNSLRLQLPMEIGRLSNMRVLDVSGNRLNYLPYTINVLSNLQALWLSENQVRLEILGKYNDYLYSFTVSTYAQTAN
jgi:protein scribble